MKYQTIFPASLLLLWTLTAFVSCVKDPNEIIVKTVFDGVVLSCGEGSEIIDSYGRTVDKGKLTYADENAGEYICRKSNEDANVDDEYIDSKIYVKFRTCDNCVELDQSSVAGLIVGNVVATILLGVAVYLMASHTQTGRPTSHKKSSDRQNIVPIEVNRGASNDHYQRLNLKGGQRVTYDVLSNRR